MLALAWHRFIDGLGILLYPVVSCALVMIFVTGEIYSGIIGGIFGSIFGCLVHLFFRKYVNSPKLTLAMRRMLISAIGCLLGLGVTILRLANTPDCGAEPFDIWEMSCYPLASYAFFKGVMVVVLCTIVWVIIVNRALRMERR